MKGRGRLVVVGAGCGGVETALAARSAGWAGSIQIIGAEKDWPYHRPPLSKGFLKGEVAEGDLALRLPSVLEAARVELMVGRPVASIEPGSYQITLSDGDHLTYDRLVLAVGGRARALSGLGEGALPNVFYLRDLTDARSLRAGLRPGARIAVIGGGFVGLEVAATARMIGCEATVVEATERLLARVTSPLVSDFIRKKHEMAGVSILTGARIGAVTHCADADSVEIDIGERVLSCNVLVVGVGQVPNTALAEAAGLAVDDGILVDAQCRTSDPAVFAIGDCARFTSRHYGRSLRLESVPNALEHARTVASVLNGREPAAPGIPWFWSDQYNLQMKMAGLITDFDQVAIRGQIESESFSVFYLKNNKLIAADTVNRAGDFMQSKKMIESQKQWSPAQLSDVSVPLKSLL